MSFSLNTSLTDPDRRNPVWDVLRELTRFVDDGEASHLQIVVKVVLPEQQAEVLGGAGSGRWRDHSSYSDRLIKAAYQSLRKR